MGKRKHKDKRSYLRKKLKRLEERLMDYLSDSDESSDERYEECDRYYNDNRREPDQSEGPMSDFDIIPLSDSDDGSVNPKLKSVVASCTGSDKRPLDTTSTPTPNSGDNVTEAVCHSTPSVPTDMLSTNPGTSASTEATSLPQDILEALGNPKGKEEVFGPKIPEEISKRWGRVLVDGLTKEQKQNIIEKCLIPDNFRLVKAPLLNQEIIPVLSDAAKNRDKLLEKSQNQLGLGISGLTNLASDIIEDKTDKIELLKKLSEISQIFLDLHNEDTKRRRKLITSSLDKKFLNMISDVKRDTYLFGVNLSEKIKASKSAERSGLQIKRTDQTALVSRKQHYQQGNWRNPTRAPAQRALRQGGKNRYSSQQNRRPPPPPDRPPRAPMKPSASTRKRQ
ncbi:hypothetical protein O0L34_g1153 [Tuta absoluta]|nr:hypothetical protein O0L34_g1153 [Tuta absoluta]